MYMCEYMHGWVWGRVCTWWLVSKLVWLVRVDVILSVCVGECVNVYELCVCLSGVSESDDVCVWLGVVRASVCGLVKLVWYTMEVGRRRLRAK